jgi:hypothetical protein
MARQPAPQGERRYLWFGVLAGFLLAVLVHQYASVFYFASRYAARITFFHHKFLDDGTLCFL